MCIAIYKSENARISKETLRRCYESNPHGMGLMYVNRKRRLRYYKDLDDFDRYWKLFDSLQQVDRKIVAHFRIKTHGSISLGNCHPFFVSRDLGFVHNGMINGVPTTDSKRSDTWNFCVNVLQKLPNDFIEHEGMRELIRNYVTGSYLVFLSSSDEVTIINENGGIWSDGTWYSNSSFRTPRAGSYGYGHSYYDYNYGVGSLLYGDSAKKNRLKNTVVVNGRRYNNGKEVCFDCGYSLYSKSTIEEGLCWHCKGKADREPTAAELGDFKDFCSECNCLLATSAEFASGKCDQCSFDHLTCENCGIELTKPEIEARWGYCNNCLALYEDNAN